MNSYSKWPLILLLICFIYHALSAQERGYLLPSNNKQWQLDNSGENGAIDADIDLLDAWKISNDGKTFLNDEIVIAIVDGGVNKMHEDLIENIWVNKNEISNNKIDDDMNGFIDDINGWNFKTNSADISNNGYGSWHGTPINGIIGAVGTNVKGISGLNKKVKILNVVKNDDTSSVFDCYEYILNLRKTYNDSKGKIGAFIVAINNSWGKDSIFSKDNQYWCNFYDKLGEVGILSVISAPNENIDIDLNGDMPSDCKSEYIISVTNTNHLDKLTEYAGYGENSVDLGAPGDYSYTTLNNGMYGYFGGTSAAAAYVTGTIGLIYSISSAKFSNDFFVYPSKASMLIKNSILVGTEKIPTLSAITVSGGRLNVYNSIKYLCEYYNEEDLLRKCLPTDQIILVYPIPAHDYVTIAFEIQNSTTPTINILDQFGNLKIRKEYIEYPSGLHLITIDISQLKQGIYFCKIQLGCFLKTLNFIKQ